MIQLAKSTGNYTYQRTMNTKAKEAYKIGLISAIEILHLNFENISIIKTKIQGLREEVDHVFKPSFLNDRTTEILYYCLAITHATDIVENLEKRFITGGSDSEPRKYHKMNVHIYEDNGVF